MDKNNAAFLIFYVEFGENKEHSEIWWRKGRDYYNLYVLLLLLLQLQWKNISETSKEKQNKLKNTHSSRKNMNEFIKKRQQLYGRYSRQIKLKVERERNPRFPLDMY